MDSRFVNNIIRVAEAEATPAPYGKVNDFQRVFQNGKPTNERFGWERLKEYVTVAARFTEQHWKIPGYLDGVKLNNKRIPPGIHWCGILRRGFGSKPEFRDLLGNARRERSECQKVWGSQGISKGDIGVLKGDLVHHFIVAEINGKNMKTINGNSMYQGITIKNNTTDEVSAYYTIEDKFLDQLRTMYGS